MNIRRTISHFITKFRFKECGANSYCIKPMRIIGGNNISLGSNVSILHFLRIEAYSNDKRNVLIKIGNGTNIEHNVHITAANKIEIGENSSILGGAVITDIIHPYNDINVPTSKQKIETKPVKIGDQCFIGMYATILPGVTLGKHVIVGAHSVVTKSFDDYCVIAGSPAKVIKRYNNINKTWENV